MQTHGGATAEAAILGHERRFFAEIKVDWNRNGLYDHALTNLSKYVDEVSTDRSLTGSAPEEIMLISGAAAAELSVTLAGEYTGGLSLDSVFSPFNGLSPFFRKDLVGCEIKYRIGVETAVGVTWYDQFVGNIREVTASRSTASVTITALDRVEKLRQSVIFPAWAIMEPFASQGVIDSQLLRSHWAIDHCLRSCDTSPSAWRPPTQEELGYEARYGAGIQFWLTGNGGHTPTIGWYGNANEQTYFNTETSGIPLYSEVGEKNPASTDTSQPQAFRALTTSSNSLRRYMAQNRDKIRPYGSHWLGFTMLLVGPDADYYKTCPLHEAMRVQVGMSAFITINVEAGQIWTTFNHPANSRVEESSKITLPTSGVNSVRVQAAWNLTGAGGTKCLMRVGASTTGLQSKGVPMVLTGGYDDEAGKIHLRTRLSMQDIYYTSEHITGWTDTPTPIQSGVAPKYNAVLSRGLNRFSFLPAPEGKDAWTYITEIAEAEFGSVFWDESGVFHFWNINDILTKQQSPVKTIGIDQVSALEARSSYDSVRNIYSVNAARKRSRYFGPLFSADHIDQFYVPGGTTKNFRIWQSDVVAPLLSQIVRQSTVVGDSTPNWDDTLSSHAYVVQWFYNGVWQERKANVSGVDINVYPSTDGSLIIRIWNGYPDACRLATDGGTPAFRFHGTGIESNDDQVFYVEDAASKAKFGPRNLELTGDWVQEFSVTQADTTGSSPMVDIMLGRTSRPIPTTDAIEMPGDPRLQLGDTILVRDPEGMGEELKLQVYGITRTFSRDTGLKDNLTVEVTQNTISYWDSAQYGRWDQTLVWSA